MCLCWKWGTPCMPVSAIPKALLSLNVISFPRALRLQRHWLWFGVFHPFVTFLSQHHAYRQMFIPVNLFCFPPVTLWISNRKNTKSPICFFITQRINTKWESLLSCRTGKPPHYSASNKHLLRVNKSTVWLSLCREWPTIQGNLSLRKKRNRTCSYFIHGLRIPGKKILKCIDTEKPKTKRLTLSYFKWHLLTLRPSEERLFHIHNGPNTIAISACQSDC